MDLTIFPRLLHGSISVIPSKSQAHRYLIASAFADGPTELLCRETNRDMEATADCLRALGAEIVKTASGYQVTPVRRIPASALLPCRDSGSTLRFLLPVAGALGVDATFQMEGRLPSRPLSPLREEMERMGCSLSRPTESTLRCQGKLAAGVYQIAGNVSSQFITGLLLAGVLIPGEVTVKVSGRLESRPYVDMTKEALFRFGVTCPGFTLAADSFFHSPGSLSVEGDWSSGAFFLAANAMGSHLELTGLDPNSCQGDRAVSWLLPALSERPTISVADIPDLAPILCVAAACKQGAVFTDIQRLRLKESDRVEAIVRMLLSLGGSARATEDTLTVEGTGLRGGTVDAGNDHRIAMSAAIAATVCSQPVTILGADCVSKSYPNFFQEYSHSGGYYEQHLR